jgi:hypothetical protein
MLANPITWIVAGLVGLALVIEDLLVWLDGGESALDGFWTALFGSPEEGKKFFNDILDGAMMLWEDIKSLFGKGKEIWNGMKDGAMLLWNDVVALFNWAWGIVTETIEGGKMLFNDICAAIGGFIDTFIIKPVKTIIGTLQKAKDLITGNSPTMYDETAAQYGGKSTTQLSTESTQAHVNSQRIWKERQALEAQGIDWQTGQPLAPALGSAGAGDTTNNNDNSVEVNVGSVTVNTQATDGQGVADALASGLGEQMSKGTQRPFKP